MERFLKQTVQRYISLSKEAVLLFFFSVLVIILVVRLFFLQVVEGDYYSGLLLNQHYTSSELDAERGQVYLTDRAGKRVQLTENVTLFNLYVDPKFVMDKQRTIDILTPIVYTHLCEIYGLDTPDKETCVKNVEQFSQQTILPKRDGVFVTSGDRQYYVDNVEYQEEVDAAVSGFTQERAERHIQERLREMIQQGIKERNYLGFFDNAELLKQLQNNEEFPYITIESSNYVYVTPTQVTNELVVARKLQDLLLEYGYYRDIDDIRSVLVPQEIRYVRLLSDVNAKVAKMVKDAKSAYFEETIRGVPLLHGLGLEEYQVRYYPFGSFMANVIGFVDQNNQAHYGVEEYFNEELAGEEGKIIGLATPWIGQVGSNDFEIEQPQDGVDIYLTIDPVIQKEVEEIASYFQEQLRSDSIAVTVLDPENGEVKGLINYPTFDLNRANEAYKLKPMSYDERYIVDDLTYTDIPVFINATGDKLRQAYSYERTGSSYKKYIFRNMLGPQVFVDKNIGFPYEPGSIFKAITLAVGIDSDSLSMFDFYNDPGSVEIGPYTIANINEECEGDNTFLHALEYSCNVGMVRIAQRMTKYVFYSYLEKLGFGEKTGIELAGEESGNLPDFNSISRARFFNNTFGQGMLATPLQMAVAYASLVNGGYWIQPTIVDDIYDVEKESFQEIAEKDRRKVFKTETSKQLKEALVSVIDTSLPDIKLAGFSLGGKTGTSEIAYKGKYQGGPGRTNGSFIGVVTADSEDYVVSVQVRRPRTSPWGAATAGEVFRSIAEFLISYDNIES